MAHNTTRHRSGFTIVELLVALTLFSIVVSIAVGGFVRALRIQRQLAAFVAANGNVSLAIEQMAREIRTGRDFSSPRADVLAFTNARSQAVTYEFDATRSTVTRRVDLGDAAPIVSETIYVRSLNFSLLFSRTDDPYPTRVTVSLVVSPKGDNVGQTEVRLQTTVSARSLGT